MTEQAILNILLQNDETNNTDDVNNLLIPDVANKVSSALVRNMNYVFNNPAYHPHHWKDSLSFIHKLCVRNGTHYHVDGSNVSLVLEMVSSIYEKNDSVEMKQNCDLEIKTKVDQFHNRIKNLDEKKHKYNSVCESILKDVRSLEKSSGLEFNIPIQHKIPSFQLRNIKDFPTSKDLNEEEGKICPMENDKEFREKHINFVYAVMNIGNEDEIKKHLKILLNQLPKYKKLNSSEHFFCSYLFKFIDEKPFLLEYYGNELFFFIEIQMINICTKLIKATEEDFNSDIKSYFLSQEFQTLIRACKSDKSIHLKIINMLYTLYCFSRFNKRMLIFSEQFNSVVEFTEK